MANRELVRVSNCDEKVKILKGFTGKMHCNFKGVCNEPACLSGGGSAVIIQNGEGEPLCESDCDFVALTEHENEAWNKLAQLGRYMREHNLSPEDILGDQE